MGIAGEQAEGRKRVVIEGVSPEIDSGRFAVKRTAGDELVVEADIFADGHDVLSARLLHKKLNGRRWTETPMEPLVNDRWRASFTVADVGKYLYTISAWIDRFQTWSRNLQKKVAAGQAEAVDFIEGAGLLEEAAANAEAKNTEQLLTWAADLRSAKKSDREKARLAAGKQLARLMDRYAGRPFPVTYDKELAVVVDRKKSVFSSWYEMFPRSFSSEPGKHGTFRDCERMLPYIAEMGFDVLYFPPVHPVGTTNRKGRNNSVTARADDPGTPWAIGSGEGGHKAINPALGTFEDFSHLLKKANEFGIELALDMAFQCTPDHPYVREHPEWFRHRPDGSIQYAENPPKKYQDIYPLDFECDNWLELWRELDSVVRFWIDKGIRIFRVDNPHTKPFAFWEWLIGGIKADFPEVIFLAEAFTRPKVMYRLAKLGFSQSYTYFTWRNNEWELAQYLDELTKTEVREYFRPSFWPNTPDILSDYLRDGGRPAFAARLVLASTLSSNYGIYGPAFELFENRRKDRESEEYLDSEKYELKKWDIDNPDSLKKLISRVNSIRKSNPALQDNRFLDFHRTDNDRLVCYSRKNADSSNVLLVIVNHDYAFKQSGWVELDLEKLGLDDAARYQVHDLLADTAYRWQGGRNYVELDPKKAPAHIFRIERSG